MSLDDFRKIIDRCMSAGDTPEAREMVYEEFIRCAARGANTFHLMKIAREIMREFVIDKKSPE